MIMISFVIVIMIMINCARRLSAGPIAVAVVIIFLHHDYIIIFIIFLHHDYIIIFIIFLHHDYVIIIIIIIFFTS